MDQNRRYNLQLRKTVLTIILFALIAAMLTTSVVADALIVDVSSNDSSDEFDTTEAMPYALAPDNIYAFIYSGYAPYPWINIDINDCEIGKLYVYNENANTVTSISDDMVTTYATTQESFFM